MQEKYYQVILKNGKTHKSLYKTIPNAIKNVGVSNIKEIKEIRKELVDTKYNGIDSINSTELPQLNVLK